MTWFYLAIASAIIWGVSAVLQKDASHGEHAIQFSASSAVLSSIFAVILIPFLNLNIISLGWVLLFVSAIISGTSYYLGAKGFKYLTLSEASPLYNLGTVIGVFLAVTILGEKLTIPQLLGISLIIFGTYILELKGRNLLGPFIKLFKSEKIHYVLWATLLSSVLAIIYKYTLIYVEPLTFLFIHLVIISVFFLVLVYTRHKGTRDLKKGFTVHRWAIVAIAALTLLGGITDIFALKIGEVALFLPVMRMWTLIAVIFGGTFYKEGHMRNRIIATTIMLAGIFIIYL